MYRDIILTLFAAWILCSGPIAVFAQQQDSTAPEQGTGKTAETPDVVKGAESPDEKNTIQMNDIHDIRPPEKIGLDLTLLYYGLGSALILIVLCLLFLFFRKYGKRLKKKKIIKRSPDELAIAMLDEIKDLENLNNREFYFQLSAILRNYIQGQYDINAPEMTTEEMLPQMDKLNLGRELYREMRDWLFFAEPVKFAKAIVAVDKMEKDLAFVRRFVKQTREQLLMNGE